MQKNHKNGHLCKNITKMVTYAIITNNGEHQINSWGTQKKKKTPKKELKLFH